MQEEALPLLPTASVVRNGTQCSPDNNSGGLKCEFNVGNDLSFTMWGVGKSQTSTVVGRSVGEDGEYSIRFVKDSPCIVVIAGKKTMSRVGSELPKKDQIHFIFRHRQAFVSPGNGYTYKSHNECEVATNALKEVEEYMGPAPYEEMDRELEE